MTLGNTMTQSLQERLLGLSSIESSSTVDDEACNTFLSSTEELFEDVEDTQKPQCATVTLDHDTSSTSEPGSEIR